MLVPGSVENTDHWGFLRLLEGLQGSRKRGNAPVHQLSAAQPELCLFQFHRASRSSNPLISVQRC